MREGFLILRKIMREGVPVLYLHEEQVITRTWWLHSRPCKENWLQDLQDRTQHVTPTAVEKRGDVNDTIPQMNRSGA
jgi:hypothetical protein